MTPAQVTARARSLTNNLNSTFVTDDELIDYLNDALKEASLVCEGVESIDTSITSVSGTGSYTLTSDFFKIKRAEYDGHKLHAVSLLELDQVRASVAVSTITGVPKWFTVFGNQLIVHPTPDTTGTTFKIYHYKIHDDIAVGGTISFPAAFHHYFVDYVAYRIYLKEGSNRATDHFTLWTSHKDSMKKEMRGRQSRAGFKTVAVEDVFITDSLGLT